jgi:hypothetical protein
MPPLDIIHSIDRKQNYPESEDCSKEDEDLNLIRYKDGGNVHDEKSLIFNQQANYDIIKQKENNPQ